MTILNSNKGEAILAWLFIVAVAAGALLTYDGSVSGRVTIQPGQCYDTDGGIDIGMPGAAIGADGVVVADRCDVDRTKPGGQSYYNLLKEAYCDGNTVRTQDILCPEERCAGDEGRCVSKDYTKIPRLECKLNQGKRGVLFEKSTLDLPNGQVFESSCLADGRIVYGLCEYDRSFGQMLPNLLQVNQCPAEHVCRNGACEIEWPYSGAPYNWLAPVKGEEWCRDSDAKDVMTKGAVIAHNAPVIEYDYCFKATPGGHTRDFIREWYCENGQRKRDEVDCPAGTKCGDGACILGEQEKVLSAQELDELRIKTFREEHPSPVPSGPLALPTDLRYKLILPSAGCTNPGGNVRLKETIQFYPLESDNTFFLSPMGMALGRGIEDDKLLTTATDYCLGEGTLVEFACTGTEVGRLVVNCPCADGACTGAIQKPETIPVDVKIMNKFVISQQVLPTAGHGCVKSIEPFSRETLTMGAGEQQLKLEDKCASDNELIEYACADSFFAGELRMSCLCKEGRCDWPKIESVPGAKVLTYRDDPLDADYTICEKSIAEIDFFKQQTRKMNPPYHSIDVCHDAKTLEEFFCTGKKWEASVIVECEGSCLQGQCVKEAAAEIPMTWEITPLPSGVALQEKTLYDREPQLSCEKTVDYFTKGMLTFNKGLQNERLIEDTCMNENELGELMCVNNNFAGWTYVTCPCKGSACVKELMKEAPKDFPVPQPPEGVSVMDSMASPVLVSACSKEAVDYTKKQTIRVILDNGQLRSFSDQCKNTLALDEFTCVGDKQVGRISISCPCLQGRCVPELLNPPASFRYPDIPAEFSLRTTSNFIDPIFNCKKTTVNYFSKETMTYTNLQGEQVAKQDSCQSATELKETICMNENWGANMYITCPCTGGACQMPRTRTTAIMIE